MTRLQSNQERLSGILVLSCAAMLAACGVPTDLGDQIGTDGDQDVSVPETYSFESRFAQDESSVGYSGQILRQVLIGDLKKDIGAMTTDIDTDNWVPTTAEVTARLNFYFQFDSSSSGGQAHLLSTTPDSLQTTYDDISSGKDLISKFAGNDTATDHKDWSTEFIGWDDPAVSSPQSLLEMWFSTLAEQAVSRATTGPATDPTGTAISEVYITPDGQDLRQLIQKFLLVAVNYSQIADDYLDDDVDGKGILVGNAEADDGNPYSSLEHHWDEGFGYFGAARDYTSYTDEEIVAPGYQDTDEDGAIDLKSEYNFDLAGYAAKRDLGSADAAKTDFSTAIFEAFLTGRAIIAAADGDLDAAQFEKLQEQRDIAVENLERVIAANVVHYINATLQDMGSIGTADYDFASHAAHWSEAKAFALGLQFNPRKQISDSQFADLHADLGTAPVVAGATQAEIDAYAQDLLDARATLGTAYGFAAANLGDDGGENGW